MTTKHDNLIVLEPCPFCGGEARFTVIGDIYRYKVECVKCGSTAGGSAFKNDYYNTKCWNKRKT